MNELAESVRTTSTAGTFMGVVTLILGLLAIGAPLLVGTLLATLVGVFLLAAGLMRVLYALRAPSFGQGALKFLFGALAVLAGLLILAQPLVGLASITLLLAVYFLADGLTEVALAFETRPRPGWGWFMFAGLSSILLALLIWWQWPLSGAWALGILVGLRLVFAGMTMIMVGTVAGRVAESLES